MQLFFTNFKLVSALFYLQQFFKRLVQVAHYLFVPKFSDFFHSFSDEIIHYKGAADLEKQLIDLLNNEKAREELNLRAEKFVHKYSPKKIAKKFIELFGVLLRS